MLNRERLLLAIDIQSRSFRLLRWLGSAIDRDQLPVERADSHSDSPDAAVKWITRNYQLLPRELHPEETHLLEFGNFFWTYVTSSFDVVAYPGNLTQPGECGCSCPLCARVKNASHLRPKKLRNADKRRALELMMDRVATLAEEKKISLSVECCRIMTSDPETRRAVGYSTYGYWLIERLSGHTDGPAILALWREIAWNKAGSPIQGFTLRYEDFDAAESVIHREIHNAAEELPGTHTG
jgi:hypothetical protein